MSALSFAQKIWPRIDSMLRGQNVLERLRDLQRGNEREFQRLAEDVGVSACALLRLAKSRPRDADLLLDRMAALDLDRGEVEASLPATLRDLQRVCSFCTHRGACARDLARRPAAGGWKAYCPNAGTLAALDAMPWAARREW